MRWVRLQHRPIIALLMEWNFGSVFRKTYDLPTYIFPYFVQKQEEKHKNVTNKVCFHDICLLPINHISITNTNNMTHCCWESVALSRRRRLLPIVWVARDFCDFIMVSYQVLNSPRLIYYFSNMTTRLSGDISVFGLVLIVLKSLLETARQCSLEKFTILSLKARSHLLFWYIERGLFLETDLLGIKLNT